jgi:ElaB/YqjD/DUF883 family membrane-anchored ribosome-binding protein
MELYYKDLISEDASLEKLVDDLMLVVQGAEGLTEASADLPLEKKEQLASHLNRMKSTCAQLKARVSAGAQATDKVLRQYPYSFAGVAFVTGLLAGILVARRR